MNHRLNFSSISRLWTEHKFVLLWTRGLIVFGVILLSMMLARRASTSLVLAIYGLVVGIFAVIMLMKWPHLGLVGLVIASMLLPLSIGTGTQTSINAAILITGLMAGLWIVDIVVRKRQVDLVPSRTTLPLIAFVIVCFLAFLNGQIQWFVFARAAPLLAQIGGLGLFIVSVGAFLLAANWIKQIVWLERITWIYVILGGVYLVGRLMPPRGWSLRELFQYGSDASIFWIWLVAITSSQAMFNRKLRYHWRIALGVVVAMAVYVSFVQFKDWKSGWLPAFAALFVIIWLGAPRFRVWLIILSLAGAVVYFARIQQVLVGDEDYSLLTRVASSRILLEIIKVNPILGLGPANYYYYTPLYSILGYSVRFNSHNNYIDIVAQIGLLGLICFIWFIWELGVSGWRLLPKAPDGFARAYVIGALGGLAGTLVTGMLGDWIIPFVYNVGLVGFRSSVYGWLFLGGMVALGDILHKSGQLKDSSI